MSSGNIAALIGGVVAVIMVITDALGLWDRLDGIQRRRR